jgi:hypothetical protein
VICFWDSAQYAAEAHTSKEAATGNSGSNMPPRASGRKSGAAASSGEAAAPAATRAAAAAAASPADAAADALRWRIASCASAAAGLAAYAAGAHWDLQRYEAPALAFIALVGALAGWSPGIALFVHYAQQFARPRSERVKTPAGMRAAIGCVLLIGPMALSFPPLGPGWVPLLAFVIAAAALRRSRHGPSGGAVVAAAVPAARKKIS